MRTIARQVFRQQTSNRRGGSNEAFAGLALALGLSLLVVRRWRSAEA